MRRGEFSRTDFDRDEFGRTRQYGSGSYGAGFGRGVSQDQDERDELRYRGGAQYGGSQGSGGSRFSGSQGSQFGSESRYSGLGRSYGGFGGGHQSYRGRGPRGYTRSDDRLKEVICEMLTDAEDIDASDIEVTVTEAVVVLDGSVDDRWTKYQTEEMAGQVPGVKDVRNQLRVGTGSTSGYGTSESTSGGSGRKGSSGSTTPKTG